MKEVITENEKILLKEILIECQDNYDLQHFTLYQKNNCEKYAQLFLKMLRTTDYAIQKAAISIEQPSNNLYEILILSTHTFLSFDKLTVLHAAFNKLQQADSSVFGPKGLLDFLTKYAKKISSEAIQSLYSIICSLYAFNTLHKELKDHHMADKLMFNILKDSSRDYETDLTYKDYISEDLDLNLGRKVQLTQVCEHYCLARLMDIPYLKRIFCHYIRTLVQGFDKKYDHYLDDSTYYYCIVLFKLVYEKEAVVVLEKVDVARQLYYFVLAQSDERVLMAVMMVVEAIFEKKNKNLMFRFYQTDMLKTMQQYSRKTFKDEDILKAVTYVLTQMTNYTQEYNSFDRWKYEVDSGVLRASCIHEKKFLQDYIKQLESQNYLYVRKLIDIVSTELANAQKCDCETLSTALSDLTIFVELYTNPKFVMDHFNSREKLYSCMNHSDKNVRQQGLVFVQKLLIRK